MRTSTRAVKIQWRVSEAVVSLSTNDWKLLDFPKSGARMVVKQFYFHFRLL